MTIEVISGCRRTTNISYNFLSMNNEQWLKWQPFLQRTWFPSLRYPFFLFFINTKVSSRTCLLSLVFERGGDDFLPDWIRQKSSVKEAALVAWMPVISSLKVILFIQYRFLLMAGFCWLSKVAVYGWLLVITLVSHVLQST